MFLVGSGFQIAHCTEKKEKAEISLEFSEISLVFRLCIKLRLWSFKFFTFSYKLSSVDRDPPEGLQVDSRPRRVSLSIHLVPAAWDLQAGTVPHRSR